MADRTCPTCKNIFKFPSRLKLHFKTVIHCKKNNDDIKLYFSSLKKNNIHKCEKCNYIFVQKSSYTRHIKHYDCSEKQKQTQQKSKK